jgi:hypothetical protein
MPDRCRYAKLHSLLETVSLFHLSFSCSVIKPPTSEAMPSTPHSSSQLPSPSSPPAPQYLPSASSTSSTHSQNFQPPPTSQARVSCYFHTCLCDACWCVGGCEGRRVYRVYGQHGYEEGKLSFIKVFAEAFLGVVLGDVKLCCNSGSREFDPF